MPRLEISKYVKVLGDFYDRNFTSWRTISRFSINADYEALELEAFSDTSEWFTNFENSAYTTFEEEECGNLPPEVESLSHA